MARRRNKGEERQIVRRRLDVLLRQARVESLGPDRDLAGRYGQIAIRVARRYQMALSPAQKAQLCKKCQAFRTSATARVRLHNHRIITTCLSCGDVHRRPMVTP